MTTEEIAQFFKKSSKDSEKWIRFDKQLPKDYSSKELKYLDRLKSLYWVMVKKPYGYEVMFAFYSEGKFYEAYAMYGRSYLDHPILDITHWHHVNLPELPIKL